MKILQEENSILQICSDGHTVFAHRLLLTTRSSVFRALFEGETAEAKSGVVEITDLDSKAIEGLVGFIYTDQIMGSGLIVDLMAAADKYNVRSLFDQIVHG